MLPVRSTQGRTNLATRCAGVVQLAPREFESRPTRQCCYRGRFGAWVAPGRCRMRLPRLVVGSWLLLVALPVACGDDSRNGKSAVAGEGGEAGDAHGTAGGADGKG